MVHDDGGVRKLLAYLRGASQATIPMVLMTAATQDAAPLLVPGAIECLAKPFDLDQLLECVARYVQPEGASPAQSSALPFPA